MGKKDLGRYFLYALFTLLGVVAAKYAFEFLTPRFTPRVEKAPQAAVVAPVVKAPSVIPAPQSPAPAVKKAKTMTDAYVLNGISLSRTDSSALINNQIVQEGETVDGALVVKIGEEEVQLKRDDRTITLTTRGK